MYKIISGISVLCFILSITFEVWSNKINTGNNQSDSGTSSNVPPHPVISPTGTAIGDGSILTMYFSATNQVTIYIQPSTDNIISNYTHMPTIPAFRQTDKVRIDLHTNWTRFWRICWGIFLGT